MTAPAPYLAAVAGCGENILNGFYILNDTISSDVRSLSPAHLSITAAQIAPVVVEQAQAVGIASKTRPSITSADIIKLVCRRYDISAQLLTGPSRFAELVTLRSIVVGLMRELTRLSTPQIGKRLGDRDHTTICHAKEQIKIRCAADPFLQREYEFLKNCLFSDIEPPCTPLMIPAVRKERAAKKPKLPTEHIQATVAHYFGMNRSDMLSRRRSATIARSMAIHLVKELTDLREAEVAAAFNRSHSGSASIVGEARRLVKELCRQDSAHQVELDFLEDCLKKGVPAVKQEPLMQVALHAGQQESQNPLAAYIAGIVADEYGVSVADVQKSAPGALEARRMAICLARKAGTSYSDIDGYFGYCGQRMIDIIVKNVASEIQRNNELCVTIVGLATLIIKHPASRPTQNWDFIPKLAA